MIHVPSLSDYADVVERWHLRRPTLRIGRPSAEPLVTIITVTRNAVTTLPACLASVASQSWPWVEHLVIDGGSSDGTVEFLRNQREFPVGWISEPDHGISDAFNKGIALARGSVIGLLNADDLYLPHAISSSVMALAKDAQASFAHGGCDYSLDGEVVLRQAGDPRYAASISRRLSVSHPTMFVRASAYARHGLYRTDLQLAMDHDFLLRLHHAGDYGTVINHPISCMALGGVSGRRMWAAQWESTQVTIEHGEPAVRARARFALTMAIPTLRMLSACLGLRHVRRWLRKRQRPKH